MAEESLAVIETFLDDTKVRTNIFGKIDAMLLSKWFKNSAVACFVAINVFSVNDWMFHGVKESCRWVVECSTHYR